MPPWAKGQSGNPGGRPATLLSKFRKELAEATNDGKDLVVALVAIAKDVSAKPTDRKEAIALMLAYLIGKPEQTLNIEGNVGIGPRVIDVGAMLGALPDDVLDTMLEAAGKARGAPALPDGSVIDTTSSEGDA